jgi:hypothetical protein
MGQAQWAGKHHHGNGWLMHGGHVDGWSKSAYSNPSLSASPAKRLITVVTVYRSDYIHNDEIALFECAEAFVIE